MTETEHLRWEFETWLSAETWAWTTYATLTFERPMHRDALRFARAWVRFIARTASEVWGFCFQETHSDGLRLHVHCLLSVRPNLLGQPSNREMWQWWFQNFGRALVVDFRPMKVKSPGKTIINRANHHAICALHISPLASYLTKYMVKEASSDTFDWDFYGYSSGKEWTDKQYYAMRGVMPTFLEEN